MPPTDTAPDNGYGPYQNPAADYTDSTQGAEGYAGGKGAGKAKPAKPASNKPPNGELNILASYVWDPPITGAEELEYLNKNKWHPGYADYVEIVGKSPVGSPADFTALLGIINQFDTGSIQRLNFFTHSNRNTVGILGTIVPGNVLFTTWVDDQVITDHSISNYTYTFANQKTTFVLDDVRSRFADKAIFVLYGCDVGFNPTQLLTGFRDLFQATTIGFKDKMAFCPPTQTGNSFDRSGEKVGIVQPGFSCANSSTRDWRSLINHASAVRVNK